MSSVGEGGGNPDIVGIGGVGVGEFSTFYVLMIHFAKENSQQDPLSWH